MMRSTLRLIAVASGAITGLALLFVLAVMWLSGSSYGKERVRRFAEAWLADSTRIAGDVTLGRIDGGSLLRGVAIHDIRIVDDRGRPFVQADSIAARYDWLDLLRGRIVINRLTAFGAIVHVERLPGDSDWNFDRVFPPSPEQPEGPGRLITFDDVRLVGGRVIVRMPVEGETAGERWVVEDIAGGRVRVLAFDLSDARSARIHWDSPLDRTRRIAIDALTAEATIFRDPVTIRNATGQVTLTDSVISIDLRSFRLPSTRGSVMGRIRRGTDSGWDFRIDAERMALADLRWLDARVPADGEGRAIVRITGEPGGGIRFRAEDLELEARNTRLAGSAGVLLGRTLVLEDVDLRASPIDLEWAAGALGRELPLSGSLTGRVTASGPLSGLRTRGDVRLTSSDGGAEVQWAGGVSLNGGLAARSLTVNIRRAALGLLDVVRPELPVRGSIEGTVTLDGALASGMAVRGLVTHTGPDGAMSTLDGGGIVTGGASTSFDLQFEAAPLALATLATVTPSLSRLRGEATGAIALRGDASDLSVDANVRTTAGLARIAARMERSEQAPHITADGSVRDFVPARLGLIDEDVQVTGTFRVDLRGTELADLEGPIQVVLDSARVRDLPIEASRADLVLAGGIARIDTAVVRTSGLEIAGSGAIGLDADRQGRAEVRIVSASLAPLEAWAFGDVLDPISPRIRGEVQGRATLTGSIAALDIEGAARLEGFGWETNQAARIALELSATGLGSDAAEWRAAATLDTLLLFGRQSDSARVSLAAARGMTRIRADVWTGGRSALRGGATWAGVADSATLRVADLAFRSQDRDWSIADTAVIHVADGVARVEPTRIVPASGIGSVEARGTIALLGVDSADAADALAFDVEIARMPFGEFMSLVRSPVDAAGELDATLRIRGTTASPLIDGQVRVRNVEFQSATLELVSASIVYADRNLRTSARAFEGGREVMSASGDIPLNLTGAEGGRRPDLPLTLTVRVDSFPAPFAMGPLPGFSALDGVIDGTIRAAGTTREPTLDGTLLIRRGAATWDVTGVRYVDVEGTLSTTQGFRVAVDLSARTVDARGRTPAGTRGGGVRITGEVDLEQPGNPGLALDLSADRILAARRRDADVVTSGTLRVTGQYERPVISGQLTIDGGNLYLDEIYRQYLIVELEDPLLFNLVDTSLVSVRRVLPPSRNPFMRNLRIDNVQVNVSAGSWMRSREMDVEVSGDLIVIFDRQQEDLRLSGTLNAIRGTYRLERPPFARVFEIEGGTIEFPGTPGIDPLLDIVASHTARTRDEPLRIEAVLQGSLQVPRVSLRSDAEPPISESDLASYLFFGAPTWGIGAGSPAGGAFGSLGRQALTATGLGYVASGLQTLAQSFGIVDYVGLTAAEAATPGQRSAFESLLSSTRIELGRYLSPRVFVAYTQRLGSPANDAGVRLEWRYHPTYTLEMFAEDRFARAPSVTLSQAIAARKVYGFFVYREWSY